MHQSPLQVLQQALEGRPRGGKERVDPGAAQMQVVRRGRATPEERAREPEARYREPVGAEGQAAGVRQEPLLLQPCVVDDPW